MMRWSPGQGLGFGSVETLDADLGASAAVAAKRRAGFERLLGRGLGEVGLILSRELSRLLRTDKDFAELVELCRSIRSSATSTRSTT
jgi:hypothetical protein